MKKWMLWTMVLAVIIVVSGLAIAAEEEKSAEPAKKVAPRQGAGRRVGPVEGVPGESGARPPVAPGGMGGAASGDRSEMMKQYLESRQKAQKESIDEIKAILKTAEEEKAPKTADMLRKLIEKKEKEFVDQMKRVEEGRNRTRGQAPGVQAPGVQAPGVQAPGDQAPNAEQRREEMRKRIEERRTQQQQGDQSKPEQNKEQQK